MPIGLLAGMLGGTAGKLLRKGASKLIGKKPGTAIVRSVPNLPTLPRIPSGGMGGIGGAVVGAARKKGLSRKAAELIAAGIAYEAGGKIFNSITGKEIKASRRMNPGNTRALKRSVRRINSAAKMYGKVLSASKGTRHSGYTIKPKGARKR